MNTIYLLRRMRIYARAGTGGATAQQIATVQKEVEQLGFVLTDELVARLRTQEQDELARTLRGLVKDLRKLV